MARDRVGHDPTSTVVESSARQSMPVRFAGTRPVRARGVVAGLLLSALVAGVASSLALAQSSGRPQTPPNKTVVVCRKSGQRWVKLRIPAKRARRADVPVPAAGCPARTAVVLCRLSGNNWIAVQVDLVWEKKRLGLGDKRPSYGACPGATRLITTTPTTTTPAAPGTPVNLRVVSTGLASVSLAWDPPAAGTAVDHYEVLLNGVSVLTTSNAGAVLTGLQAACIYGTPAVVGVEAVDASGQHSDSVTIDRDARLWWWWRRWRVGGSADHDRCDNNHHHDNDRHDDNGHDDNGHDNNGHDTQRARQQRARLRLRRPYRNRLTTPSGRERRRSRRLPPVGRRPIRRLLRSTAV